jgi:hypothetical protein
LAKLPIAEWLKAIEKFDYCEKNV